jgi:nickel-type superoxide dismutase maturation protease
LFRSCLGGAVAAAEAHGIDNTNEMRLKGYRPRRAWAAVARLVRVPTRVVVSGPSMLPTLRDGDRCMVRRTRRVAPGELVVFVDPVEPRRLILKRVSEVMPSGIVVAGDNPGASRDSRDYGVVPRYLLVGVARYRYSPRESAGPLR